jgi:hypothetical protein
LWRPASTATLLAILAEEPPRALFVFRRHLAGPEAIDALQQRLVFAEGFVVAELFERDQARGLDIVVVRFVEQYLARVLLQFLRLGGVLAGAP